MRLVLLLPFFHYACRCDRPEPEGYPYAARVTGIKADCREWMMEITEGREEVVGIAGNSPVAGC